MLVALGGCEPQVKGHVAANLRVGRARLIDVLTQLLPFIGYPHTLNGLKAIDKCCPPDAAFLNHATRSQKEYHETGRCRYQAPWRKIPTHD